MAGSGWFSENKDFLDQVLVIVNDVLLDFQIPLDQVSHVCQVLQRLLENKLYVKAEKCEFHTSSVEFLGFILREDRCEQTQVR